MEVVNALGRPKVWSVASTITHSLVTVALFAEMVL